MEELREYWAPIVEEPSVPWTADEVRGPRVDGTKDIWGPVTVDGPIHWGIRTAVGTTRRGYVKYCEACVSKGFKGGR